MNAARRKLLDRAADLLSQAEALVEQALEEEQEAYENLPESLQAGERGGKMQDAILTLEEMPGGFDQLRTAIDGAKE